MQPKPPGTIITFYSYKGGTGRTMALANVAWLLASNGKKVLAVDWDLEAPGLHRYFQPFLVDKDLTASDGIIELVLAFSTEAVTRNEGKTDKNWYLPYANILRYAASLDWKFADGGTLDFVSAGRQTPSYSVKVNTFDWQNFYERLGGGVFLEAVREVMRQEYDYVLIDSRTGVSDTSGICTIQMPDALVVCFTLNNQSIEGAARVIDTVGEQRHKKPLPVYPVPMRVDNSEKDKLEARREVMHNKFALLPGGLEDRERQAYWLEVECLYIPWYAYEEVLATFGDKPGTTRSSLLASTERLCHYLSHGAVSHAVQVDETIRQDVLAKYARKTELPAESELDARAEAFFSRLIPDEQAAARRVFTRLVRVPTAKEGGPVKGVHLSLREIEADAPKVIPKAASAELLQVQTQSDDSTVALASDKLITDWRRLREWIEADREFLLWRQKLRADLAEWEKSKDSGALLSGTPLNSARKWRAQRPDDLTKEEKGYIDRSGRFRRIVRVLRGIAAVGAVGLVGQSIFSSHEERGAEAIAKVVVGDSLVSQGALDSAIKVFSSAVELDPKYAEAYRKRGDAYVGKGDTSAALADYDLAIRADSSGATTYFARATILIPQGKTREAMDDLRRGIARSSNNSHGYYALGLLHQELGNTDSALTDYQHAVRLEPRNPAFRLARASAYEASGRRDSAVADYQAVLTNFTDQRDSVLAATRLRQLGFTSTPAAVANRVYVHYRDSLDLPIVRGIVESLKSTGWLVMGAEHRTESTRGDVRFFYQEDRRRAAQLASAVGLAAARQGIKTDLTPIYLGNMRARRGQLEVWLPPLAGNRQGDIKQMPSRETTK